nr:ATP-binding cassette domain-containing protein [Marinicella sp. W31]MDC2877276.1 ATP-binding cassette domain-containing protein [Marinicella sp. W31]
MSDYNIIKGSMPDDVLISVRGLKKHFTVKGGHKGRELKVLRAVDDVSFDIRKGETFGLVGESGSGKSTVARLILRAYTLTGGQILFRENDGQVIDISAMSDKELRPVRREMQMIFQDPYSSLNPRMTLLDLIGEPMVVHGYSKDEIAKRVGELLSFVGLRPEYATRYPTPFPVVSARGSASRARLLYRLPLSRPMRRFPRSTFRLPPRTSTCCRTCRRSLT